MNAVDAFLRRTRSSPPAAGSPPPVGGNRRSGGNPRDQEPNRFPAEAGLRLSVEARAAPARENRSRRSLRFPCSGATRPRVGRISSHRRPGASPVIRNSIRNPTSMRKSAAGRGRLGTPRSRRHPKVNLASEESQLSANFACSADAHLAARSSSPSFSGPSLPWTKNPSAGRTNSPPFFTSPSAIGLAA
jgi:hypothetical protein